MYDIRFEHLFRSHRVNFLAGFGGGRTAGRHEEGPRKKSPGEDPGNSEHPERQGYRLPNGSEEEGEQLIVRSARLDSAVPAPHLTGSCF